LVGQADPFVLHLYAALAELAIISERTKAGLAAAKRRGQRLGVWGCGRRLRYGCVDWIGADPFEVAKPEEIFNFYRARSLQLLRLKCLKTCACSLGCNEFVFQKKSR
jgi:hypothetical protein